MRARRLSVDAAVAKAHLVISTCTNSTDATIQLARLFADDFDTETFGLAADRVAGTAAKTGPEPFDDDALLQLVAKFERGGRRRAAIGIVCRLKFPFDPRAQAALARRLRRKRD